MSGAVFVHSISAAQANQGFISMGQNPIFSKGGYNNGSQNVHTISAVANQEIVVTDISISAYFNHDVEIIFNTAGGSEITGIKHGTMQIIQAISGTMNANFK